MSVHVLALGENMSQSDKTSEFCEICELNCLAEFFKVYGDPTRLKILKALIGKRLCVQELVAIVGVTQSAVSHQLSILRRSNLVRFEKEGRTVFYQLDDDHIERILIAGIEHIRE